MSSPIKIYSQFDVVVVPFPFTDSSAVKRRPALILSDAGTFISLEGNGNITGTGGSMFAEDALHIYEAVLSPKDFRLVILIDGRSLNSTTSDNSPPMAAMCSCRVETSKSALSSS
jgi:hypothetical protein